LLVYSFVAIVFLFFSGWSALMMLGYYWSWWWWVSKTVIRISTGFPGRRGVSQSRLSCSVIYLCSSVSSFRIKDVVVKICQDKSSVYHYVFNSEKHGNGQFCSGNR
jgi:hypothetical protein